jgi:plasmid stabilization system protein ParE
VKRCLHAYAQRARLGVPGIREGYDFHPEASIDLDEIWDFIAADNPDAADK